MSCENANKATVAYTNKSGSEAKFETSSVPITTECSDLPRTGKFIFTVKSSGYIAGGCTPIGDKAFSLTVAADSYTTSTPPPQIGYESCFFVTYKFWIDTSQAGEFLATSDNEITSIPNPNYSKGGKYLVVKNAQGNQIFKAEVKECGEIITCDDDCPPGHIKCSHNKYPGYCCIPCGATASKINNLASKVGK